MGGAELCVCVTTLQQSPPTSPQQRIDHRCPAGSYAAIMITVFGLNSLLAVLLTTPAVLGIDVFCGTLTIFEQQRFGLNSVALSSQETTDLKQCLELCCSVLNCRGVTFTGVITPHEGEPNCLLVGCRDQCEMNERADYTDGLISVLINRTQTELPSSTNSSLIDVVVAGPLDSSSIASLPEAVEPINDTTTTTKKSTTKHMDMHSSLAPLWAVGVAIVVAVVCVGLNLGLLSAYICYRRKRSRKQTAQITINKGPTLHAYNPTI